MQRAIPHERAFIIKGGDFANSIRAPPPPPLPMPTLGCSRPLLTINGTINYMGRGIMIFRRGIDRTRGIGGLFWALESPERIWAH